MRKWRKCVKNYNFCSAKTRQHLQRVSDRAIENFHIVSKTCHVFVSSGSWSGSVYRDPTNNCVEDSQDNEYLDGVTVHLWTADCAQPDTKSAQQPQGFPRSVVTDQNGDYTFDDLRKGCYIAGVDGTAGQNGGSGGILVHLHFEGDSEDGDTDTDDIIPGSEIGPTKDNFDVEDQDFCYVPLGMLIFQAK